MLLRNIIGCILVLMSTIVKGEEEEKSVASIGQFAREITPSVWHFADIMSTCSLLVGIVCLFIGFTKYLDYRKNAYGVTMGSVMGFVLPAVAFVSFPFLSFMLGVEVNPL